MDAHKNLAVTTIASAPVPALSGVSVTVTDVSVFPAAPFNVTMCPVGEIPTPGNAEIARVTSIVGSVLTLLRAQEGTTAKPIQAGYMIANTVTVKVLTDIETAIPSTAGLISGIQVSAGASTSNLATLVFSNASGVSFGLSGQTITASVRTDYQSSGAYLTTAALSQDSSKYAGTNGAITGGSITVNTSGVSVSLPAYLTTALGSDQFTRFVQATALLFGTNATGTIASNGISVSVGNYITTAMASNRGSDFVGATAAFAGTNASGTIASGGISVSVGNYITTAMASNRGTDFVQATAAFAGTNASGTIASNGISVSIGNYLTTAALSNHSHGNPTLALTNLSGTTASNSAGLTLSLSAAAPGAGGGGTFSAQGGSSSFSTLNFSNANGFTFSNSNGQVVGSYTVPTLTDGSNTIGISNLGNTSGTSGVVSGQSVRVLFAGGNNITLSQSINGLSATITISGANLGGAQTGISGLSAGTTQITSGTVSFSNASGVSWGVNGQTITASVKTDYLTTAMASNAVTLSNIKISAGTLTALRSDLTFSNSNGLAFGLETNGVITGSYTVPAAGAAITISDAATSGTIGRLAFTNLNGVTLSLSTGAGGSHTLVGSHNALTSQSNQAFSADGGSSAFQTLTFANSFGVSWSNSGGSVVASIATTYAGTGFTSAGANISLSGTHNTAGLSLSASVAAQTNQSAIRGLGVSNTGQTAGNTGISTGIDWVLAGSGSITLSQSTAVGGPNTVWVQHPAWITTAAVSNAVVNSINGSTGTFSFNTGSSLSSSRVGNAITWGLASNITTALQSTGAYLTTAMASNAVTLSNIKVSAGAASANRSDLTFADSNGIAFGLSANGVITASYTVPAAGAAITISDAASSGTIGRLAFTNLNGVTLSISTGAGGSHTIVGSHNALTTAAQSNQVVNSINGSTGVFSFNTGSSLSSSRNGNSITFGLASDITTALQSTGAYLTTADLSQNSSRYVQNWKLTGNTSGTTSSANGTDLWFSAGNGVTLSGSSGSIVMSVATNYQSQGAYLTTAMQSNAATISNIKISAGASSANRSDLTFADSNGISFGLSNNGVITASYTVPTAGAAITVSDAATSGTIGRLAFTNLNGITLSLSTGAAGSHTIVGSHNALTTAMQSNAATISNIKISAGAASANRSDLTFADSNGIAFGLSANGVITASYTVPAAGAAITVSDAATSGTIGRLAFTNLNGITLSLSTGAAGSHTVVGSHNALTTAAQSNQVVNSINGSTGTFSFNTGSSLSSSRVGNAITFGLASDITTALQSTGAYLTTAAQSNAVVQSINGSTGTFSFNTGSSLSSSRAGNAITWGLASNITTALQSAGAYLTTADLSQNSSKYVQNWKLTGNTAGTSSSANGTDLWFSGGNGVTISGSSGSLVFSVATNYQSQGAYLTTAALSQDSSKYAGTNGAITGGSITVNTSGVSVNLPAYITTAMASNRGSDFVQATAAFAGTNASGTIASNGISVSVAAPGAAAENNWFNLVGANTSGNTTASGSTIGLSGGNGVTLSGTNNSQIVVSVSTYDTLAVTTVGTATTVYPVASANSNGTVTRWAAEDHRHAGIGAIGVSTSGNEAGTTGSNQGTYWFEGGSNITVSQITSNNGSHTIVISGGAAGGAGTTMSMFANIPNLAGMVTGITQTSGSSIFLQPFSLQLPVSLSYLRMLVSLNDSAVGTGGAPVANSTYTIDRYTTFGLGIYSNGTGASSNSLQQVTSTSGGITGRTIAGAAAQSSRQTMTLQKTYPQTGANNVQYTTSYGVSSASLVISSNSNTLFTGPQYLDIPFAIPLSAGVYWLGVGASTSSATSGGTAASFIGTAGMAMSIMGVSQSNLSFGLMGSATQASANQLFLGLGVWTTNASGFTKDSIGLNSISHVVSNMQLPFWMMRQN